MRKFILPALLLAAVLLVPPVRAGERPSDPVLFPQTAEAPTFADVAGTWCEGYVNTVCRTGLMKGRTDAVFDAATPLTNAQIVVIIARLHNLLQGESPALPEPAAGQPWFQSAEDVLRRAYPQGNISLFLDQLYDAYDPIHPEAACSRERFVRLLSAVVPEEMLAPLNQIPLVLDTNDDAILFFYRAGVLTGNDAYGTFSGASPLTRGAAAAVLARISDPGLRQRLTVSTLDLCRDVLGVPPDTVLLTVEGQDIPAELFAPLLCLSLYQWQGSTQRALANAYTLWCGSTGLYHPLARDMDLALTEEELAACIADGAAAHGLYGARAAYHQYVREGEALHQKMLRLCAEKDEANGERAYASLLAQRTKALEAAVVPAQALETLDLTAAYRRLMASPLYQTG